MMKLALMMITVAAGLVALTLTGGCATEYIYVNGVRYQSLTAAEEHELVLRARVAITQATQRISPDERNFVARNEPEIDIRYTADRYGKARISWTCRERIVAINFEGHFLAEDMFMFLETEEIMPEFLRFGPEPLL